MCQLLCRNLLQFAIEKSCKIFDKDLYENVQDFEEIIERYFYINMSLIKTKILKAARRENSDLLHCKSIQLILSIINSQKYRIHLDFTILLKL